MSLVLKSNVAYTGSIADLPYRYIFEGIEVDALVGCSLMKPDYNGALMRIERVSDNTELDIFPQNGKYIDEAEVLSFANGSDVRVMKLYDQTGNNNHFSREDVIRRPFIVKGGVLQRDSAGLPALTFDDGNQALVARDISLFNQTGIGFYLAGTFDQEIASNRDTVRDIHAPSISINAGSLDFKYKQSDTLLTENKISMGNYANVPIVLRTFLNATLGTFQYSVNSTSASQSAPYVQMRTLKSVAIGSAHPTFTGQYNMRGKFSAMAIYSSKKTADALL